MEDKANVKAKHDAKSEHTVSELMKWFNHNPGVACFNSHVAAVRYERPKLSWCYTIANF